MEPVRIVFSLLCLLDRLLLIASLVCGLGSVLLLLVQNIHQCDGIKGSAGREDSSDTLSSFVFLQPRTHAQGIVHGWMRAEPKLIFFFLTKSFAHRNTGFLLSSQVVVGAAIPAHAADL